MRREQSGAELVGAAGVVQLVDARLSASHSATGQTASLRHDLLRMLFGRDASARARGRPRDHRAQSNWQYMYIILMMTSFQQKFQPFFLELNTPPPYKFATVYPHTPKCTFLEHNTLV